MQKPITPMAPVQSSRAASQLRAASISSNDRPFRARASRITATMHDSFHRPSEQVGRDGLVTLARQPVDLVAQVLAHPHRVMNDNDTGPRTRPSRRAHVDSELTPWRRDRRLAHCYSIAPDDERRSATGRDDDAHRPSPA